MAEASRRQHETDGIRTQTATGGLVGGPWNPRYVKKTHRGADHLARARCGRGGGQDERLTTQAGNALLPPPLLIGG